LIIEDLAESIEESNLSWVSFVRGEAPLIHVSKASSRTNCQTSTENIPQRVFRNNVGKGKEEIKMCFIRKIAERVCLIQA
jgi:hypothetical protein